MSLRVDHGLGKLICLGMTYVAEGCPSFDLHSSWNQQQPLDLAIHDELSSSLGCRTPLLKKNKNAEGARVVDNFFT